MQILHLERASRLPICGGRARKFLTRTKKEKSGRGAWIRENDCSGSAATATSCAVFDKPGCARQARGGYPLRKSEVRIGVVRSFVEKAISSLKRLGTGAYPTQERHALSRCSEGRRISFSYRRLRRAGGICFAVFQKDFGSSVQNDQNFSLRQPTLRMRRPDSRLTLCHNAASPFSKDRT